MDISDDPPSHPPPSPSPTFTTGFLGGWSTSSSSSASSSLPSTAVATSHLGAAVPPNMHLIQEHAPVGDDVDDDERTALLARGPAVAAAPGTDDDGDVDDPAAADDDDDSQESQQDTMASSVDTSTTTEKLRDTLQQVLKRCLQPPVVGALLGMAVASVPRVRGIFVDMIDRSDDAPLEWMFDGLYEVGQAAVPINMIILGCNLSASYNNNHNTSTKNAQTGGADDDDDDYDQPKRVLFSQATTMAIVLGKMVVMPIVGFLSALLFRTWFWQDAIPDDIAGSFYLVILIVFLTPTANNVMVMVEIGGGNESKQAIARVIAWQYAVAPVLLSLTMTAAVGIADQWS